MIETILKRVTALSARWKPVWVTWLAFVGVLGSVEHLFITLAAGVRTIRESSDYKALWADVADLMGKHDEAKEALLADSGNC